ncbi:sulfite exporter TauE/SafE family protein [soil metagenome]
MVNTVVGSGTLITFPTLLAVGFPPVLANVSNTVGLAPGSLSGAIGYRRELAGQRARLIRLGAVSTVGAVVGGLLLLRLPPEAFRLVVPVLILLACVLVIFQPRLSGRVVARRRNNRHGGLPLLVGVFGSGMYGGYFGAAQGVILIGLLGTLLDEDLQRVNAAKNVLAFLVNGAAALLFIVVTEVSWSAAGLIAAGSVAGAYVGATVGRRIPAGALRVIVVIVGVVGAAQVIRG